MALKDMSPQETLVFESLVAISLRTSESIPSSGSAAPTGGMMQSDVSVKFGLSCEGVETAFYRANEFMDSCFTKSRVVGRVSTVPSPHFPKSGHCFADSLFKGALQ